MMKKALCLLFPLMLLLAFSAVACVLAYGIYLAVDGQWKFDKIISRSTLVFLLLSIYPLMRWLGLDKSDIGYARPALFLKQLLQGLGLGLLTLLPVLLALWLLGVNAVDPYRDWGLANTVKALGLSLLFALLISLTEEPLFRGVLLTGLAQKTGRYAAMLASAVYYASLHFLRGKGDFSPDTVQWYSGFPLIGKAFGNLFDIKVLSAWLALFVVGLFLAMLRTRIPQGLGLCIGCHAGWVWQIKMTKAIFDPDMNSPYAYLVSSYDGVIGPLVSTWMLLALAAWWAYGRLAGQR